MPPAPAGAVLAAAALLLLKSTLLLGAAVAAGWALRRASAASRHLLWSLALLGLLALPALTLALPSWRPAFLAFEPPATLAPITVTRAAPSAPVRFVSSAPVTLSAGAPAPAAPMLESAPADGGRFPLVPLLVLAWAVGAAGVLMRLARGLAGVGALARGAEPVFDPAWTELLERMAAAVGVRRPVRLLRSPAAAMPMTWGALRPAVLLPADADGWTPERKRVVLLHELAHVARRDCLTQTLAEVACALWWFHPGAWWAARRMRREREQACDDLVLAAGARASDYAGHLVDVARAYRGPAYAAAIAMARPSHLEDRVRAVLDAERDRRGVTARTGAVCAAAVLLAVLPLAAVSPSAREDDGTRGPKRVSLTVPVHGRVGADGRVTGRGTAQTTIDGVDVHLDLDVRMTLDGAARPGADDGDWRAPAFAEPPVIHQVSDPAPAYAPEEEAPPSAEFRFEGVRVVLRDNAVLEITVEDGDREVVDLRSYEPRVRAVIGDGISYLAAHARAVRLAAANGEADEECPETRKLREVKNAVKMAAHGRGDVGRLAAQLLALGGGVDDLSDAISAIISEAGGGV